MIYTRTTGLNTAETELPNVPGAALGPAYNIERTFL